jgi:hypothetical protein
MLPRPSIPREKKCEQVLHALPAEWAAWMRAHGAFTSAGNISSPQALLHALCLYCGPDQS